jgi:hypothetical protein
MIYDMRCLSSFSYRLLSINFENCTVCINVLCNSIVQNYFSNIFIYIYIYCTQEARF